MTLPAYAEFEATARAQGFDEVLERIWGPGLELPTHSHTFAVTALVTQGEFWLSCGDHLSEDDRIDALLDETLHILQSRDRVRVVN